MNQTIKSILTTAAVVAVLCIPSYIAVADYVMAQNAPVDETSISVLEITDIDGNLYSLNSDNKQNYADIAEFISLNENAIAQNALPDPLLDADYFEFKYFCYDRMMVYKYYFTENPNDAYYVDHNGKAYHIATMDAEKFLSSVYARCLYDKTPFPTMTVSGEKILPTGAEWAYQTYGGDYIPIEGIVTQTQTEKVYRMKGAFALNFDNQPDLLTVTVKDGNTVVFRDIYENIANANLEGKNINVTVEAKWYQNDEKNYCGTATYQFKAKILIPAVFYMGETEIEPGEFVVITAKNVDEPEAVGFSCSEDIGYTPTFYASADGESCYALIPIPCEIKKESVNFRFTYGEVSQDMTLNIKSKTFKSVVYDVSATLQSQTFTEDTRKAFDDTLAGITETSAVPLWTGNFLEGVNDKAVLRNGFGIMRTVSSNKETYRYRGVYYVTSSGADVMAVNNGKVVYTGYLELTGYTVIVDHGLGLRSVYCHLAQPRVAVGDSVAKGDVVGYAGTTGFTPTNSVAIGLFVGNVAVCPYDLWDNGIIMAE